MDFNEIYKVYIKVNDKNEIYAVNSSAFLPNSIIAADQWIEIDEGAGDKYHHAQGNYFELGVYDTNSIPNYKYIDGSVVEMTDEDKQPYVDRINALARIAECKANLASTDYISIKINEGVASREQYAVQLEQRQAWRDEINELEATYLTV